jgi:hypothetical protein
VSLETLLKASVRQAKTGARPKVTVAILGKGVSCAVDAEGEFVLPPTAAECADLLYKARERRLELDHESERVKGLESKLQDWFITNLSTKQTGVAGQVARVQVEPKNVPQVEDWDKLYAYIKRTGAWELLQRRLGEAAVKERWDAKKQVPGVTVFHAKKVSCVKL